MNEALNEEERVEFESYFRSLLERGAQITRREATAYLRAVKATPPRPRAVGRGGGTAR